ncbi:MAG TPA: FCD domain-containing protein [Terriglobales bacterium]|nr:FCD domain-containing protein [Terriglobales bacterium]
MDNSATSFMPAAAALDATPALLSKTHHLFEILGQAIISGECSLHFLSSEMAIEKHYDVSRSVAREAILMLRAKGLVSSSTKQGLRVEPLEKWNLIDPDVLRWIANGPFSTRIFEEIIQVRLAIEPRAAYLAALKGDPAVQQTLRGHYSKILHNKSDKDQLNSAQLAFHLCIIEASGNRFMRAFETLLMTATNLAARPQYSGPQVSFSTDYGEIVDAVEKSKPQLAEYSMKYIIGAHLS